MRITAPAEKCLQKMAGIVRKSVDSGESTGKPARKQIDGERKPVHFSKKRHHKCRKSAECPPLPPRLRLEEAKGKDQDDQRVNDYQRPQTIICHFFHRRYLPLSTTNIIKFVRNFLPGLSGISLFVRRLPFPVFLGTDPTCLSFSAPGIF